MRVAAIIYGAESGIVRRIVVSDTLKELAVPSIPGKGEDVIILDPDEVLKWSVSLKREVPDLAECIALVEAKRGKPSESARSIVVNDKGEIETALMADPSVDVIAPTKALYQHPEATAEWTMSATGEFERPLDISAEMTNAKA